MIAPILNGAAVPFDLDGGLPLALLRAAWMAALITLFGSLVFRLQAAPTALARLPDEARALAAARLARLIRLALVAALLAGPGWLLLQAGDFADTARLSAMLSETPTVLTGTRFGHLLALQLLLVGSAGLAFGRGDSPPRRRLACLLGTAALVLQAGHGHAAAMAGAVGTWMVLVQAVHLLGAGAWLGGLPPLLLLVWTVPAKAAASAARAFSTLGKLCIVALLLTASLQAWVLVGSIAAVFGTGYGWMALVKLALLGSLLGFAAINRYRLAPALLRGDPGAARRALGRSIALQTGAGLAILLAASVLASLPPGTHVQPVWPFNWQFSLTTLREAPELREEVVLATLALGLAVLLLPLAWMLRRRRLAAAVAVVLALAIGWNAVPHLDLLLVTAEPTSFQTSPTGFTADAITRGAALYPAYCASCHGVEGHGDGPLAHDLSVPPADLTAPHLWAHADGELLWWLSHGIEGLQDGTMAMPGFADALPEDERWDLIDYIRAHNAGLAWRGTGHWSPPIQAPGLQATCPDGSSIDLADLRGRVVRLRISRAGNGRLLTALTVPSEPGRGACVSDDQAVADAYAIASGAAPGAIAGAQALVDGDGWLRALQPPDVAPGWNDPDRLAMALAQISLHPITAAPSGHHGHHGA